MPRPALTDEQRSAIRRNIRKAAAELYAEKGIGNITARTVAEKAGVSVGTLYAYFDNLTELMQSLWREPLSRLINDFEVALKEVEDPRDKLKTLMQVYTNFALTQGPIYRGAFLYVRPEAQVAPAKVGLEDDRFFQLFCNTVIEAQQLGLIREGDPVHITQTLWAGLHGAFALPTNMHRLALDPPEEGLQRMTEVLLEWLKP